MVDTSVEDRHASRLHDAARSASVEDCSALLEQGVPVGTLNRVRETALHLACSTGSHDVARLLCDARADVDASDMNGDTPLHCCAHHRTADLVGLLVARGARVDAANRRGDLPLHAAAWGGCAPALRLLVERGARVDARGFRGETPLMIAALHGSTDAASCLLRECGASVDATDGEGRTALHLAAEHATDSAMPRLLIACGAAATEQVVALLRRSADGLAGEKAAREARRRDGTSASRAGDGAARAHSAAWADRMRRMPPLVRRLLVDGDDPASVPAVGLLLEQAVYRGAIDTLTKWRGARSALDLPASAAVLAVPAALSGEACAALRRAVDTYGTVSTDSVDGLPNRDLALNTEQLAAIVGADQTRGLLELPGRFHRISAAPTLTGEPAEENGHRPGLPPIRPVGFFARRYSAHSARDDQPLTSFHMDSAALTVNVALTDDAAIAGGRLLGVYGGAVHAIERREGDATVHSSSLLHAVSAVDNGVRFSLIMFFARG